MERCSYCDASFESESALLDHLADEHDDELGRIDRRRVDDRGPGRTIPVGRLAIGVVGIGLLLGALLAVYLVLGSNGGGGPPPGVDATITPHSYGTIHEHGLMVAEIDDERLDFASDERFILADDYFHFHGGDNVWHIHGRDVTLEYALATLGIAYDGERLTFDGETYDGTDPGTTVSVTVNGESVDPTSYRLQGVGPVSEARAGGGDTIEILVEHEG